MKKGFKWLLGIVVIAVIGGMIYFNLNKNSDEPAISRVSSRKAIPVKTVIIETGDISSYVTAPGKVKEINKAQVFFDTPLRVLDVLVSKNDRVEKGQRMVELDTSTLTDEMERLKMQKEIQSITLKKLESGQNLLTLETNLASARNSLERAVEAHQTAQNEYEKQKKLYETGVIPAAQLDQYERAIKDAKAAVDAAQLNLDSAEKAYQSSIGGHGLDIQVQIKNIELLSSQISDIEKKLKKIKSLENAPISGYVTEVNLIEGGYTMSGQPAFTIIDVENLQITATVNEYNAKGLEVGQSVEITGEALGDDVKISGKIVSVAPLATVIQSTTGMETVIEVMIEPLDGKNLLKPGLNVDCDIITHEKKGVVIAEHNIFMPDKDRKQYVMVVDEESMTLIKRYPELGIFSDMTVEIIDGFKAGDRVVVDPQPSLKDGDKIKIME